MSNEKNPPMTLVGELQWMELRYTEEGNAVVNFILSHTPTRYDKQEQRRVPRETMLMPCCVWGDKALKFADQAKVGDQIVAVGELRAFNIYKRYKVELWCSTVARVFS